MKPQFYVYLHCRPDGTPFYVGKGTGSRCFQLHRSRNEHHQAVVAKYGEAAIQVFVFTCESEFDAMQDEKSHIAQLRHDGYRLCNKTDGGEGFTGGRHSTESRRLISESLKGNTRGVGRPAWNKGVPISDAQRIKQANAIRGRRHTPETIAKMSAAHKGENTWSKGRPSPTLGVPHTAETRLKMSLAKRGQAWSSARRAAQQHPRGES